MSKVAKYRRQVSEDPDIDNLLSTLSPEEMEELEKELDVVDAEGSSPTEKNRAENSSPGPQNCDPELNHHGREPRRVLRREQAVDETRLSESKGDKNEEEKGKETPPKDLAQKRDPKVDKDSKKEEGVQKTEPKGKAEPEPKPKSKENKAMNDKVKAMEKKLMGKDKKEEEKGSVLKKDTGKDHKEEEKSSALKKEAGKDKKEEKGSYVKNKDAGKEKKEEEKGSAAKDTGKDKKEEKVSASKKDTGKDKKEEEKSSEPKRQGEKATGGEGEKDKLKKEEEKGSAGKTARVEEKEKPQAEAEKAAAEKQEGKAGPPKAAEPPKDDEASSIFDELIEKVKNNDAEVTEVNVNNSDCINNETLVRFTEALEFNTVVKVFALANTRADDHVAFAISIMLKSNKVLTSINLDSNHITGKGILAIFRALLQNDTLTELRFHNQRHICGGKTEMEIAKLLKENTTLLKLGYHFELAGPRMTVTNLLSRNMDRQRQRRLQEQKLAQERGEKKDLLQVPKAGALPKGSPKASPQPSPKASLKSSPKAGGAPAAPPPPPPPLAPPLINENLRNSLSPATQRKLGDRALPAQEKNSRDQLLAAIRSSNLKQLKKVELPKLLQ
ncbi:leiomodin-1 [Chiroxiphia lanceolata]|uniref:leiomodin-1 n=1 Tax=Chiroxiphia lanceolata TaxID=296741 RepID=UPI0013CE5F27|nr:leiomodin-1 [Chiroxiphia lanceolata]XP_032566861.1 leiomodin-1 [Chiroxiphia lanceolata]